MKIKIDNKIIVLVENVINKYIIIGWVRATFNIKKLESWRYMLW